MMAGFLAGLTLKSAVSRRSFGSSGVFLSAMARHVTLAYVQIGDGLKIRVSAVRFCPWPLSSNYNARRQIGSLVGRVAARVRFGAWRGFWRAFATLRSWT
jgi:hypothetical protein